jgi:coproporphyrinogen III oxidase
MSIKSEKFMELSARFREMELYVKTLQDRICQALEQEDTQCFHEDLWERPEGGGGRTRVLEGSFFEKGGVNISVVHGEMSEAVARQLNTPQAPFAACGISLVVHPRSPRVPTVHMNVRTFETESGACWFGGGVDLTPYYPHPEDFQAFHQTLHQACEAAIPGSYAEYKRWCDEYFTVAHRGEMRGVGGVFFDYLDGNDPRHADLVRRVGDAFLEAYLPIVQRRREEPFTEADKQFQLIRRGRYVEFNLVYDRGTLFGLKTNGRIESILMSLPPEVHFRYDWHPDPGSPHEQMQRYYQPQEWLNGMA